MTCRFEDPWEEEDAVIKKHLRMLRRLRYLICFSFMTLLLFFLVFALSRLSSPKKIPQWHHTINALKLGLEN